jgi:succinate dehydrogenase / fumarate reductase, flavoprotein subunit
LRPARGARPPRLLAIFRHASLRRRSAEEERHATSIPGLYAVGEVDYQYHGANRLGANPLLSCIYGGMVCGPAVASYQRSMKKSAFDLPKSIFEKAEKRAEGDHERILKQNQDEKRPENAYRLHQELGELMLRDCTIERENGTLDRVLEKIGEMDERARRIKCTDSSPRVNQGAQFVRHLENMLVLARVIAQGARNRNESRGAHYKPEFPVRNDAEWLRTTLARHEEKGSVKFIREFDYSCAGQSVRVTDAADTSLVTPRERKYEQAGAASAASVQMTGKLEQKSA